MKRDCQAKQYSDQMCCGRCGLAWDIDDPEPPGCLTDKEIRKRSGRAVAQAILAKLREETPNGVAKQRAFLYMRDKLIHEAEEMAVNYAGSLPAGAERVLAFEVAEVLHDLGCR